MSGIPSNLLDIDYAQAVVYAKNKSAYSQCTNKDIRQAVAKMFNVPDSDSSPIYNWIQDAQNTAYPCTSNDPTVCPVGTCSITSEQLCNTIGAQGYPYDEDSMGNYKQGYDTNSKFNIPYVAWRTPDWSPNQEKCVVANPTTKRWCISPGSRSDQFKNGVTNVPPFSFDESTGKCNLTQDYCEWMDQDWDPQSKTCKESTGEKVAQFFLGKTIFGFFDEAVKNRGNLCGLQTNQVAPETKENFKLFIEKHHSSLKENYDKLGTNFEKLVDDKMIKEKFVFKENFLPGINLYMVQWKDESPSEFKPGFSFISSELEKVYPQYIKKKNGLKYLVIPKQDISKPDVKKLYGINIIGF